MDFWLKSMWPPYSPDANPLDFSFWLHVEARACSICHPNVDALKAAVNKHWDGMDPDYIIKVCKAFGKHLEAIIMADGGYIE